MWGCAGFLCACAYLVFLECASQGCREEKKFELRLGTVILGFSQILKTLGGAPLVKLVT